MIVKRLPSNGPVWTTGAIRAKDLTVQLVLTLGAPFPGLKSLPEALRFMKCNVADQALPMLEQTSIAAQAAEVDLVFPSVGDLGYKCGAELKQIMHKALALGLEHCPAEVAPQLCLQYPRQLPKEHVRIGMQPLEVSKFPFIYAVFRIQGKLWLGVDPGMPHNQYGATCRFVFIKPPTPR